jgi:K+-sensing histidine kinase KdpD
MRRAARIAAWSAGDLLAVHAARPAGPTAAVRATLAARRQLTVSLGGTYHHLADYDIRYPPRPDLPEPAGTMT